MTDLGHDVATLLNRCIDLECQRDCVMVERDALRDELKGAQDALVKAGAALSITQRTCRGSWANGWTIYVTGHEMNAIRDALGLPKDKEEPSPLSAIGTTKETHENI